MTAYSIPNYGATDLKNGYNRNLGSAFVLAVVIIAALIGLYQLTAVTERVMVDTHLRTHITVCPPGSPVKPQSQPTGGGKAGSSAAAPAPEISEKMTPQSHIPDAATMPTPDMPNPSIDGDGHGKQTTPNDGTSRRAPQDSGSERPRMKVRDDVDLPDTEFVEVEEEAHCDMTDLQRRVMYPEIARRNGIQGVVVLRALVDRRGNVVRTIVDRSDNRVLEEAARDAVVRTRFTPAIQNKTPVAMWIQVPVSFRIE